MKEQRLKLIEEYVTKNQSCSLELLAERFNVSMNTIRRDIRLLVESGSLKKVYGGVTVNLESVYDREIYHPDMNIDSNQKIAEMAAELVEDSDIIYLGSGSTVASLVPFIKTKDNLTVVTNSALVIVQLINDKKIKLVVVGGDYDFHSRSFIGSTTLDALNDININKSFISSNGISVKGGMTNTTSTEALIKRLVVSKSPVNILLADHSKFNITSLYTILNLKELNYICTDSSPDHEFIEYCNNNEVKLLIA